MDTINARTMTLAVRAKGDDERDGIIEAYASVFDTRYDVGFALERIVKGAFEDSLAERDSLAIYHEHGWKRGDAPIGVAKAEEDDVGLRVEAELFLDDPKASAVYRAVDAGALTEWSIGFVPTELAFVTDDDGLDVEEVRKADLLEASTTIRGANPDTTTEVVRSMSTCPVCSRTPETRDERDPSEGDEPDTPANLLLDPTDPAERRLYELLARSEA